MKGLPAKLKPVATSHRPGDANAIGERVTQRLVIIGNGMVGFRLLEQLDRIGCLETWGVTVFGAEPQPALDRVNLTDYLRGTSPTELELAGRDWYEQRKISLHTSDPVVLVDRDKRVVHSRSGRITPYDRLVFATGSRAFLPNIPGSSLAGVFVYRDLDDLTRLRDRAQSSRSALVIGGGLLGLEAAEALLGLGLRTHVVERGSGLMSKQLDPDGSRTLQQRVEAAGITVHNSLVAERIDEKDTELVVEFRNGTCIKTGLVVFATGIRPRDELAAACSLELGPRGGIRVNDQLQTSDPHIHAIGECASHDGIVYGLVLPGYEMAAVLAEHLKGRNARFSRADQSAILKLEETEVAAVGQPQADCPSYSNVGDQTYRRISVHKGRLIGAIGVGDWPEQARIREAIKRGRRIWPWNINRFIAHGRLWKPGITSDVGSWPNTAEICNCMSVCKRDVVAACAAGCTTLEAISCQTRAGTVCGSCRPLIAKLVGIPASGMEPQVGRGLLFSASLLAVLFCGLNIAFEIPFSQTVTGGSKPERFWTDPFIKQVTGFTLAGLSLLAAGLSLRKRIRRFAWGEFGHWRAVHAALGGLTLIVLVTHTGLRLGANLNLLLMFNFLALAFTGAVAGAVTALEARLSGSAAVWVRRSWTLLHILLVWPLPVLVFFHAFASYYY